MPLSPDGYHLHRGDWQHVTESRLSSLHSFNIDEVHQLSSQCNSHRFLLARNCRWRISSHLSAQADNQTCSGTHLANTFGNSSHLVVYPGESLSRRIVHERAIPSEANCRVRRPYRPLISSSTCISARGRLPSSSSAENNDG